jgi:phosphoglycolate phosphatase
MADAPLFFDAVLFDLDGTLVATDRFWVDAAHAGARRAFAELGLERRPPSSAEWMSLVGLPLAEGFARLFPDLPPAARARVQALCEEEEHAALRAGGAALIPGVPEMLAELAERGVRLGIASNCGQDYLRAMLEDLGLARWVRQARCLDSPGVTNKAGMLAQLVDVFGTRAAVVVGDRQGDRDAAWANGLPHVHFTRGFAQPGEEFEAEGRIDAIPELVPLLERRSRWLAEVLDTLDARAGGALATVGVTGPPGAGKSLFARDLARLAALRGLEAEVVALEDFLLPSAPADLASTAFVASGRPLDLLARGYDLARLAARLARRAPGKLLVLHGSFLAHPALRPALDALVHLALDEALCLRRLAGRDARAHGTEALLAVRRHLLPASRAFDAEFPPAAHADLVLDGSNPLGPEGA